MPIAGALRVLFHKTRMANPDTRILAMKSMDVVELSESLKLDDVRREAAEMMFKCMSHDGDGTTDYLRAKSERIARELAPVQIASFECS